MKVEISEIVKAWHKKNKLHKSLDRIYIFGSLVNDGGELFWPSGLRSSDIDILVRFNPELLYAEARVEAIVEVASSIHELEAELARVLDRGGSWQGELLSVLPVTWYEIYHCVHKGFDPKIFTLNIFWDVLAGEEVEDGLTDFIDRTYQFDNTEVFAAMRLTQKLRNDALKLKDKEKLGLREFDDHGAVPKEFMRAAALLKFARVGADKPEARTNLAEGEEYIEEFLEGLAGRDVTIAELLQTLKKRRNTAISKKPPLIPRQVLLLGELLFDHARSLALPSARETIDRRLRLRQGKKVYY